MTPVLNHIDLLKELLSKFTEIIYISESELELMNDYIFSDSLSEDMTDDSEIYETLGYLHDLAQENKYSSVDQLICYFDKQQAGLDQLIEPMLADESNDVTDSTIYKVFNLSFKTESIKLLTVSTSVCTLPTFHDMVKCLYRNVRDNLEAMNLERTYKELNFVTQCQKRISLLGVHPLRATVLPNSDDYFFKHYFQNFSLPGKKYSKFIYVIKWLKSWFSYLHIDDIHNLKNIISKNKKERKKARSFYELIFKKVKAEQPIENEDFKTMLSKMMLTSKLNNPKFREYIELKQNCKESQKSGSKKSTSNFMVKKMYYKCLAEKKWSILKSPAGHSWITSDNPGFSIDIKPLLCNGERSVQPDPYWMDIDDKSMIYFPLSQEYCLRLRPVQDQVILSEDATDHSVSFEMSTEEELKTVNSLVLFSKPEVVISGDKGIQLNCKPSCP